VSVSRQSFIHPKGPLKVRLHPAITQMRRRFNGASNISLSTPSDVNLIEPTYTFPIQFCDRGNNLQLLGTFCDALFELLEDSEPLAKPGREISLHRLSGHTLKTLDLFVEIICRRTLGLPSINELVLLL